MSSAVSDLIEKQNFESETVNLLTEGSVPEDCDLLIIDGPTSDLADDEKDMLTEYMAQGGHMMILLTASDTQMPNLKSLWEITVFPF